jgi:subtilisin family serine protease
MPIEDAVIPAAPGSDEPIFRLPPVVIHPTPSESEIKAEPWHIAKTRIADARGKYGVDGSRVKVAVGDTGFDKVHCETGQLVGRVASHHDFTNSGVWDLHGHSTHVAGLVLSMAPKASLVNVKCLDNRGSGDDRWIGQAIRMAVQQGCVAFNGSFGSSQPGQQSLAAIKYANENGCICVIAGGNTGQSDDVQWPARSEMCLSVSPIDENDKLATFGSQGKEIDVAWYGVRMLSLGRNGGFAVMSGSSMAAPVFCGLLALRIEWEIANGGRQTWTVEDSYEWLARTCRDVGAPGRDPQFGFGIPDAMLAFAPPAPLPVPTPPPGGFQPVVQEVTIGGLAYRATTTYERVGS